MKKILIVALSTVAICATITGCFTVATAKTKTTHPDGTITESIVSIKGTGDKASQVAAEGMFADGTLEDLGAGVKSANSNQQSSGIDGSLAGLGQLLTGMAQLFATMQTGGALAPTAASE